MVWADNTTTAANPTPQAIIDRIAINFNSKQRAAIQQVATANDLPVACPRNFVGFSQCYAGISFNSVPGAGGAVDYTLLVDNGLAEIDVEDQKSDYQQRVLPMQWAIDKVPLSDSTYRQ